MLFFRWKLRGRSFCANSYDVRARVVRPARLRIDTDWCDLRFDYSLSVSLAKTLITVKPSVKRSSRFLLKPAPASITRIPFPLLHFKCSTSVYWVCRRADITRDAANKLLVGFSFWIFFSFSAFLRLPRFAFGCRSLLSGYTLREF